MDNPLISNSFVCFTEYLDSGIYLQFIYLENEIIWLDGRYIYNSLTKEYEPITWMLR